MKLYTAPIVGESNYQPAIAECSEGDTVRICREPDNPHDALALAVETIDGHTIGYIARSSWIREAVHDEGRGIIATIKSISSGDAGMLGVVLYVTLTDDDMPSRAYAHRPEGILPTDDNRARRLLGQLADISKAPVTCECGAVVTVPLRILMRDLSIACAICGQTEPVDERDLSRLDVEFASAAKRLLRDAGLPELTCEQILEQSYYRANRGHNPTVTEQGFLRRLFKRRY